MKREYNNPEIYIIDFDNTLILTASVVVGGTLPGDEVVDGSDLFA